MSTLSERDGHVVSAGLGDEASIVMREDREVGAIGHACRAFLAGARPSAKPFGQGMIIIVGCDECKR